MKVGEGQSFAGKVVTVVGIVTVALVLLWFLRLMQKQETSST